MVTVSVNNNAELMSALSGATGGDRIELFTGDYGVVDITETFASDVTIVSRDPANNPATIRELDVDNSTHLIFDSLIFKVVTEVGTSTPFLIRDSSFITIRNSFIEAYRIPSGDPGQFSGEFGFGFVLHVKDSNDIVIEKNDISWGSAAVVAYESADLTLTANNIHTISVDTLIFVSINGLTVDNNWIHDFWRDPDSTKHPDMLQCWTVLTQAATQDVIIRDNFFDAGDGDLTQSIFMSNGLVGGVDFDDLYKNILIEDNIIFNGHIHGIKVDETDGLTIRNNTLLYDPEALAQTAWAVGGQGPPRITLETTSVDVIVDSNITQFIATWDDDMDNPGWTESNTLLVQDTDSEGANYYGDLLVNPFASPAASLGDLRALADGVIETNSIGAERTRANIALVVGPVIPNNPPFLDTESLKVSYTAAVAEAGVQHEIMSLLWDEAMVLLGTMETELMSMKDERDAALVALDVALQAQADAEAQLANEVIKLDAIRVIVN